MIDARDNASYTPELSGDTAVPGPQPEAAPVYAAAHAAPRVEPEETTEEKAPAADYVERHSAPQLESSAETLPDFLHTAEAQADFPAEAEPTHEAAAEVPEFIPDAPELVVEVPDPTAPVSPETTAEIDVKVVEAKLNDPGSTQSFAPITDDLIDTDATFDAGTSATLMWGARSDVGCVRSHNEDSYLVASPLFCVCDGMGGHAAGEVASAIAVETVAKMAPKAAQAAELGAAIEAANSAIIEAAVNGVGRPGMGCTATAAYIEGTTLAIAHVGDSRAYLMHEGTLIRVTRDHSFVEELVDAGEITADEARVHPNRSVITRALGSDPHMYADHFTINIEQGDRLILCSDGLSSMVPDGEIEHIAAKSSTAQICTDNLVDAALAAGGGDNVTVVVVDVTDDGREREMRKRHRRSAIIGAGVLLAFALVACIVAFTSITGSVYLGVKDEAVAIYKGVPGDFMGFDLHWLEDETSVLLVDLPVDTQKRLHEGIPQESIEAATETVSSYRKQIDEELSKQAEDAKTIKENLADGQELPDAPEATASPRTPADSVAASDPASAVSSSSPSASPNTSASSNTSAKKSEGGAA